uniref:C-type lectin domain-containing protein n=1 Tax=Denticeps clupeoides TaxID=299321 RepID=A0AAY4A0V0_9TELE
QNLFFSPSFWTLLLFLWFSSLCWSDRHQYHFVNEVKTWTEAQLYCREHYTDLATVDGEEDENALVAAVTAGYSGLVWIGLYSSLGSWAWSFDNSRFYGPGEENFRKWSDNQPIHLGGNLSKMAG